MLLNLLLDNFLNKIIDLTLAIKIECIIIILNLYYVNANNKIME